MSSDRRLLQYLILVSVVAGGFSASAFTTKDVETISGAYSTAFYQVSGTNGWFKDRQSGGVAYFWGQAEMIETIIDAYEWTSNSTYKGMITSLLNGFLTHEGRSWSWNIYNDDIMWAVLAFARGGVLTGNQKYCDIAKANFDLCYARAWDTTLGGGLYWTTDKASKNACSNGNAAIAAYLLYQIYGDLGYLTKANAVYNWERSVLFNADSGMIADYVGTDGAVKGGATTYNQGTCIGAAHFLNHPDDAARAANFTMMQMTSGGILPQYGIDGNNSGFNAIFLRWMTRFMKDRNLESTYEPWLQTNAAAAWNVRRADNLSWCQWRQPSPEGTDFFAWDCISSLSAILAAYPTQGQSPYPVPHYPIGYWPLDELHGGVTTDVSGNQNDGMANNASWSSLGRINGCLTFNGVNTTVQITNGLCNDFSIAFWLKTTQTAGSPHWYNGVGLVDGDTPGYNNDFGTALVGSRFAFGVGNPDITVQSMSSINDGNWHLCVATREQSSGSIRVYVDGNLDASGVGGKNTLNASSWLLFGALSSGGHYFNGNLDEVQLFTRTLSSSEVTALYHSSVYSPSTAPSNVTATASNGSVQLNWNDAAGETSYNVKRSLVSGGPYTTITNVASTSFTDSTVANNRTYYYVISGVNAPGEGADSPEASANSLSLTAWFAADAIWGVTSGAGLARWTDLSRHGNDAIQPIAPNQPSFVSDAMNGRPVVRFNSADSSYLWLYRPVQDDFTIIVVYQSSQGISTGTDFWNGAGLVSGEMPAPVNDFAISLNANGQILAGTGNPDRTTRSPIGFNDGQPHIVTFKRTKSNGTLILYVDGNPVSASTAGTQSLTAPNFLVLGAQGVLNNYLNGDIAEVQIYSTPLSDVERIGQERALKCKYGLAGGGVPVPPTGLAGVAGNRQISLNWTLTPGAMAYNLKRSTNGGATYEQIAANLTTSSYVDTNAIGGQMNVYRVTTANSCGESSPSVPFTVYLPMPALGMTVSADTLEISWPEWASDWQLYGATNLAPPVEWVPVTNSVENDNGQFKVNLPMDSQIRFFRLAYP